jgi:adenylate cyclase
LSDRSLATGVLTIMMTDVVGSTMLRRARGDRNADEILSLQAAIVHDEVRKFEGRVRKSIGDGFLISFPSTVAAVRAAVAIQQALQEHNAADTQHAVEIRIGIHAGPVTEHDDDLQGQTVNAAARVVGKAVGGQILTSNEVRKHAEPLVEWAFLDSGLFGCEGFPSAGGSTKCVGAIPQWVPDPVLCRCGRRSWGGRWSGPACAGS